MRWRGGSGIRRNDRSRLDRIKLGERFVEIGLPFRRDLALIGRFSVTAINLVHDVHAGNYLTEGGKAVAIEAAVVPEINEQLRGARAGTCGGKRNCAGAVALGDGIVMDIGVSPG